MAYSVQKSRLAKVAGVSLVMLLAACSSDSRYKRQVSGDESYLDATPLAELHAPAGMILPLQNGDYNIPVTNGSGAVGKALDIRPPAQPLALVSGARTQFTGDTATLMVENGRNSTLWPQVVSIIQAQNYSIDKRDDASQSLTTGWVDWNRLDEDQQYRGRYQISVKPQGYQQSVVVKLLNLEQAGKPVADAASLQRYSTEMLNVISGGLDKSATDAQNAAEKRSVTSLDVQSSADDTGLPMLVVRGPFNIVWQRLPGVLEKVGMKVTDSTRSTGSISVTYKLLSDSGWRDLGARDPGLSAGDYKLQVGDLDNRSSLQFIDPKGHTLTQSQNDALVAAFQSAFNH
ncbi:outer membrane protein assembly factor BamC [Kosakonia radicincitans DSM 16656]|uniref:outer membrane protein assembly factor BamC n=1 Tax=Kosakonia radicincitans TaxID=283686 RepID=UPI000273005F|nr:outer membrane protein assembly factor BamC [Kosakonia radicincitans]ARD59698.1 outer membrane protein assembly factor BamC [Kosakonia radicincitans DSM 16656]